ncbi:hypothetical protein ACX93W_18140 [Paenibacillus sp. CAU 1782]
MAKNRLLFSTPPGGVFLRQGTREWLTGRNHHGHHHGHHHHHDRDHHDRHHHGHHDNRGISIAEFETIRVVATNRSASSSVVSLVLLVSGRERDDRDGRDRRRDHHSHQFILDRVRLAPGESFSRSYRVPGEILNIVAIAREARRRGGCRRRRGDIIDVAVFGHK